LGCNNFGDYKFTFNVIGTDIKGEASLKLVADTQTNTPSVDNTTSDVVVDSNSQDNNVFNFKVLQGDEGGYFNNLTEIPNGGRTFDTTPTFVGKSVANDTIVLGFVKANNATGQDELIMKEFQAAPDGTFTYTPDLTNRVDGSGWEVGTYKVYLSSLKTGLVKEFTFTIDLNTAKDEVANDNNANVDVVVPSEVVVSNNHITINEGIYYQANSNSAIEKINGYVTDSVSPVITGTAKPGSELIVNLVNDATGKVESWTNITIWDSGKFEIGLTGEKGNSYHYEVFDCVACKPVGEPAISHTFEINAGNFINLNPSAILGDDAGISIPTIKEEKVEAKDETKVNVGDILDTQKDIFNETIAQPAQVQEGYINLKLGSVAFDAASKDLTHLDEFNNINHHS
ncbi:hypothetical protein, partial [Campylobacter sp. RM9331]|uniref:hypothetical protein n=2 Tax=unclassified Campylobacter TaxID=2593542 RepID=UPI001DA566FC|nr:hypothetical protein [Campylobacter sp. RM9331]